MSSTTPSSCGPNAPPVPPAGRRSGTDALTGRLDPAGLTLGDLPHERAEFAHNAERQFAALLDFYGVAWQYEPRTFVLAEGPDGLPTLAFTPDFYLPEDDVYVEVTTLNQRLVTRKNRKLRLLRERHPEIDVRILYQRDYLQLLVKYGLEPPSQLSGTGRRFRTHAGAEGPSLLDVGARTSEGGRTQRDRRPTSAA